MIIDESPTSRALVVQKPFTSPEAKDALGNLASRQQIDIASEISNLAIISMIGYRIKDTDDGSFVVYREIRLDLDRVVADIDARFNEYRDDGDCSFTNVRRTNFSVSQAVVVMDYSIDHTERKCVGGVKADVGHAHVGIRVTINLIVEEPADNTSTGETRVNVFGRITSKHGDILGMGEGNDILRTLRFITATSEFLDRFGIPVFTYVFHKLGFAEILRAKEVAIEPLPDETMNANDLTENFADQLGGMFSPVKSETRIAEAAYEDDYSTSIVGYCAIEPVDVDGDKCSELAGKRLDLVQRDKNLTVFARDLFAKVQSNLVFQLEIYDSLKRRPRTVRERGGMSIDQIVIKYYGDLFFRHGFLMNNKSPVCSGGFCAYRIIPAWELRYN